VVVTDPQGQVVKRHECGGEGRFVFTSQKAGEHSICISPNSTRWVGEARQVRMDLRINVGEMAIDYQEVAKKEHLGELGLQLRRINDKIQDIHREQTYQRRREVEFRDTSESTCERVMWWSLFQMGVLVLGGLWSTLHLTAFFRQEKLK
jgi:p24 family protein alpha